MENKYKACMILHALGDTIGFKNGDWEFNYIRSNAGYGLIHEMIYEFIDLGGINGIDLKGWHISDDTLYHIAIANGILRIKGEYDEDNKFIFKKELVDMHNRIQLDAQKLHINRYAGANTTKYILKFNEGDAETLPYDPESGGNGCAMRSLCIGLAFFGENNRSKLIELSIRTSKLTHNSPYGYLAGLTSAYFTALAIEGVNIYKWPFMLIELLKSKGVKKYVNFDSVDESYDYNMYVKYWRKYIDTRFSKGKPLKTKIHTNLIFRSKYYFENFVKNDMDELYIGGSGHSAMIMAYDSLIDCDGKWEKLIFYSILHPGDSDTVGAITGGLYGVLYGLGDVPTTMLDHLEEKNKLTELGEKIYHKFYLGD